jgi:hypothetical protein
MSAYICLNCEQIERGDEDCCGKPDLFCINDMPGEILKLREALRNLEFACTGVAYMEDEYAVQLAAAREVLGSMATGPVAVAREGI